MSFRNPLLANFYAYGDSASVSIQYRSGTYERKITSDKIISTVCTAFREYKSIGKIKQPVGDITKEFLLPIFQVTNKTVDYTLPTQYIVNCKLIFSFSWNYSIFAEVQFESERNECGYHFYSSDEFMFMVSMNANRMITEFAKTFRFKPDPNISLGQYFDSYYKSTNFALVIKNGNGKVLC
jgi:hypothetical protein